FVRPLASIFSPRLQRPLFLPPTIAAVSHKPNHPGLPPLRGRSKKNNSKAPTPADSMGGVIASVRLARSVSAVVLSGPLCCGDGLDVPIPFGRTQSAAGLHQASSSG